MAGFRGKRRNVGLIHVVVVLVAFLSGSAVQGEVTIRAASVSRADVGVAVSAAHDGDTVLIPAGSANWKATLSITKNISLIGAGEGKTVITADLPMAVRPLRRKAKAVSMSPPLISVSLSHESRAPGYSFRLSGFTLKSANTTPFAHDHPYIKLVGQSKPAASPAPYVLGCVSRVRIDHMTWDKLNGLALIVDSCLGVADHITLDNGNRSSPPIKVYMNHWTPSVYDNNGSMTPVVMTTLAKDAYGSWADDPYFGTDKFWFFEDCNFTVSSLTNVCDNQEGGRIVFRHCTMNGGSCASHGMEGPRAPGVRVQEIYNNYFNFSSRPFAQTRSGTILWFNNLSVGAKPSGWPFHNYRLLEWWENWGAASGNNRYDENAGGVLYSGTVTSTTGYGSITDSNRSNFNLININDGSYFSVNNLSQPMKSHFGGSPETADPGWKYLHSQLASVSGKTLSLKYQIDGNGSPQWKVGDLYEVRKLTKVWGQVGLGKGTMMSPKGAGKGSYETYRWPATSGTKITFPNAGYPLEPAYSWNNYNISSSSYLGFDRTNSVTTLEGRDFFNLGHIVPETTQKVGYPEIDYTHATTNYPKIGPSGQTAYKPYTYPHPLTKTDTANSGHDGARSGLGASKAH